MVFYVVLCFEGYGDHRDLHVLTHSFPTRRSSDLVAIEDHYQRPMDMEWAKDGETGLARSRPCRASRRQCGNPDPPRPRPAAGARPRSEEHTSELQSLMRISYAVFCLKQQTTRIQLYIQI